MLLFTYIIHIFAVNNRGFLPTKMLFYPCRWGIEQPSKNLLIHDEYGEVGYLFYISLFGLASNSMTVCINRAAGAPSTN